MFRRSRYSADRWKLWAGNKNGCRLGTWHGTDTQSGQNGSQDPGWFGRAHPSHFNIEEAIEAAREVGAARTYLTHLTHRVTHAELEARLPDGVLPAYDGLTVEID